MATDQSEVVHPVHLVRVLIITTTITRVRQNKLAASQPRNSLSRAAFVILMDQFAVLSEVERCTRQENYYFSITL